MDKDYSTRLKTVLVTLAALAAVALTARLGFWQLDRAAQKLNYLAAVEAARQLPALSTADLAVPESAAPALTHRLAKVRGRWHPAATVFLDNRQMNGRPGFFVVTPLILDDGDALLVQRGWIPRDASDRTRVSAPTPPAGVVEITGRVAPPPSRLFEFAQAEQGVIRQNLDLASFGREIGLRLRPMSLQQLGEEQGLLRQWPLPQADVSKHHGYAFQWFALSALVAVLYVWFQIIQPRRRRTP